MSLSAAAYLLLLVAAGFALARVLASRWPLLVVTLVALAWPVVPRGLQGPRVAVFAPGHGLHVSDALTPVLLVLAAAYAVQLGRARPGATRDTRPAGTVIDLREPTVIDLREPAAKYSRAP